MNDQGKRVLIASLLLASGAIGPTGNVPRRYLSRTSCAACGTQIPPGRPGRRCVPCRESDQKGEGGAATCQN